MEYDVIVIGAGQAGVPLATRLAGAGRRVLLAERKEIGGPCVNTGCTPTKTRVVNVGARPAAPAIPGLAGAGALGNRTVLELTDLPAHLVVLGGGYIGCELAQMFRRFGSAVTVVERGDRLLAHEDLETSAALQA